MQSMKFLITFCFCIFGKFGICQTFDGECSSEDGTYSGKKTFTNTGKVCYPWRSDNKCFKGITDVNSTFSHNYCRNPIDPSDCHQDIPWCYTDQNNGNWEFCDLPKCGSEPPSNCSSPLGMGDGRISDDQIYAPTFMDQSSEAKYARLNQTNAKYWRASWNNAQYAYLSVNLRIPHFITKIHIQGTNGYFTKKFKILYSLDGYQWEYYTENKDDPNSATEFEGNHGGYDISIAYIKYPFVASKIAIIPVSFSNVPTLRIELFGCSSKMNIPLVTEVTAIDSNTYWYLDKSPYVINAPITIPPGVLLKIEAGVKVIFTQPTSSLVVSGCLELRGIKGLEVKFLTNNILSHMGLWKNPFNNDESFWNGILINPDSGCILSSLNHVVVVGAGITTGIKNIEFENLKISNSKSGLKMTSINENNVIRGCLFRQNLNGIETPRVGSLTIESSQFIENEVGVRLTSISFPNEISTNFMFVETLFRDNVNGIFHGPDCMRIKMNFTILRSNFSNHRDHAISATQHCEIESLYSLVSSVFSSSSIRISSYSNDFALQILNSTVRDLRGKTGISIESRCKNLTISGCTFTNISSYSIRINVDISGSTIRINSSKFENNTGDSCMYLSGQQTSSIYLINNTFLNNSVESIVNFYLLSSSNIFLSKNIFKNFQSKYEISNNIIRSSTYSILASDNYWGVNDIDNISSRIFDFYKDSSKSFVEILTYFKDESFTEIVNSSNYQSWLQKNGTVGGRVDVNTTLSSSVNLNVTKNVFIPKGSCLIIKGPIKLEFLAKKAIVVEGGCIHSEDSILTSRDGFWNGISFINSNGSVLSNVTITKTELTLEITNSSIRINKSNISSVRLARISGQNYNMLEIYNTQIVCSETCIRVEDSIDLIMKVTNSSITSISDAFYLDNIKRLQFSLSGSTLDQKYQSSTGVNIKDGLVEISNCISKGSIRMSSYSVKCMIKESNFSSDSYCLQFGYYGYSPESVTILDNVFNCKDISISKFNYNPTNSSLVVVGNKFLRGELQILNNYPSKLIITNNYFNGILRPDKSFIEVTLTGKTDEHDKALIANNVYENVIGSGQSSVIKLSCTSDGYNKFPTAAHMRNNTFRNNSVTNTILTDCIGLTSEKNILNNPNSLYEMKVLGSTSNDVPQLMYFTRNFWGENVNDPNVRVYDETNDRTLMKVRVDPWYNDSTMTRMVFRSEGFIKPSGEIGGTLTQNVVLHNKESAYLVTEDITIPTGLKMTIESGVQLNFVSGGMNIQGILVAKGNETNYITFNSRDANKKWKGLNFQRPISKALRKLDFGWWKMLHNGVWKTVSLHDNSYKKATTDVLCRQAGFKESVSQTIIQCNPDEKSKLLPCINSSIPIVKIQCTKNNEMSLQECYISESRNEFANITCLKDARDSEYYIRLQTKSGKWISFNDKTNTLQLVNNLLSDEDGMFLKTTPCQSSQETDCFSVMPIQRLGWYWRFYQNEIIVDLAINNKNPSTFLDDSSFVRINKASSEYFYIRMASQSVYFIENNNTLSTSTFDPLLLMNETDDAMYSFKIINLNQKSSRQKRDIGFTNEDSESSILEKVKITNSDKGLFIRGVPPKLEDIEITDTTSHGIHFVGFFTGETPIFLNRVSISNSSGNAIYFELTSNSGEFKVLIEDSKLENCKQDCITWNGGGSLNVSKSSFKNFKNSAVQAFGVVGTSNISITTNSFFSSTSDSVIVLNSRICEACYFVEILENKFINLTQHDSQTNLLRIYAGFVTLMENLFDNVSFSTLLSNRNINSYSFENNRIANSRFVELLQHYDNRNSFLKNNVFVNNTGTYMYRNLKTLAIYSNDNLKTNIINNSFFNPESQYEIDVHINWDTSSYRILDLSMNKWLYGDYSKLMSKINCFYNDASKLPVNIWPAIAVQNNSETFLTRPTSDSTYFFNATGGEVTFSFTIPNTTNKYIFQNSILIPVNVTLSIEPGTIIEFASSRGIVAYGDLKISPVEGQFITFTKASKMEFYSKSDEMSMTNMFLDANEIKFNSSKLDLSNIILNSRTSVISHNTLVNNCSFYGGYYGITWNNLLSSSKLNYSTIVIQNSIFQKCSTAVKIPPIFDEIKIVNSTFLDNYQAFVLDYGTRPNLSLSVINCSFINNYCAVQGMVSEKGVFEIAKCYFKKPKAANQDVTGIDLRMSYTSMLNVNENVFEENVQPAIKLDINWNGVIDKKYVTLRDNQFINISKTSITMLNMYGTDMNIYRNNFIRNNGDTKINAEVSAIDYGFNYDLLSYNWPLINVSFSQNNFHGNGGKHVVKIWNSMKNDELLKAKYYKFELLSNSFLNNSPSDSVIATAIAVNISYNTFSNPLTKYDLVALFPSQFSQNCTMNDWGTTIPKEIRNRIKDNRQDPLVGQVIYEPYLKKVNVSCEGVNSCSGHGLCVDQNVCQCESEWDGISCSNHSCSNVYNCLGRGDCVALDTCSCNNGWTGKDCSVASCDERNNCSGGGLCIKPNECACFEQFSGLNCSECKSGRWGLDCAPCPNCEHGTCNKASGKCDCISPHWSGELCEQCRPKFFKQNSITVNIKENSIGNTSLVTLNRTEGNCDQNGLVLSFSLEVLYPNATNVSSVFKMRELPGTVDVILTAPLDREEYAEYFLEITATDSASPPHASSANITVLVEDENDCKPMFLKNSSRIIISGNTSLNAILYTFNVSDCDEIGQIKYSMESNSSYEITFFNLEETSGILRLSKSLTDCNFSSVTLNIKAFDGKFSSKPFQLNILISDKNTYLPVFEHKFQTFYLNETTPVGYEIAILTAIDEDSLVIYYDIVEGNDNGIFAIDMMKGMLTLVRSLDFEKQRLHKLIISAYDGIDKSNALNGTSEVNIVVRNVNEFHPEFVNTSDVFYINVEEGKLISRLYQFVAKDGDNDSITFMMVKSQDSFYFTLDSSTGWLSVIIPLNKSLTSEIMLQIVAKDNGNPAFATYLNVTIVVLPYKQATITVIPNSSAMQNYFGITESLIAAAISISFSRLACWISF